MTQHSYTLLTLWLLLPTPTDDLYLRISAVRPLFLSDGGQAKTSSLGLGQEKKPDHSPGLFWQDAAQTTEIAL